MKKKQVFIYKETKNVYPGVICGGSLKKRGLILCFSLNFWPKLVRDKTEKNSDLVENKKVKKGHKRDIFGMI